MRRVWNNGEERGSSAPDCIFPRAFDVCDVPAPVSCIRIVDLDLALAICSAYCSKVLFREHSIRMAVDTPPPIVPQVSC
jgi:hypothetical protein